MDEELFLENALFPWLDDPSYDEAGDDYEREYEEDDSCT